MTDRPTIAVALHDGFYGSGTGAGYANRGFLQTLIGLIPPSVRLVVMPVYLADDSPQYQADWHRESVRICQAAKAVVRPLDNGTRGQTRFGDVPAFRRLATSTAVALAGEIPPGSPSAVIFLDIPFLGAAPLLPDQILPRLAVVPRSTGLLHDPGNKARIQFEGDGLRYIVNRGGRIAAISGYMRNHLTGDYHVPAGAVLDLPDGLTAGEWSVDRPSPPDLPARAEKGFLLSYARAEPYKGWDDLVAALAQLRDRGAHLPHALLAAVTDQPGRTAYQQHLASRIESLDLDATLVTGFDPAIRSLLVHPALRAVVIASRAEPFGRVPLEAYAAGAAPVVVTTAGGLAEQVIDGVTGLAASPADPASLAGAIDRALRLTADEVDRMRAAGRHLARTKFDCGVALRRFLDQFAPSIGTRLGGPVSAEHGLVQKNQRHQPERSRAFAAAARGLRRRFSGSR
jgi:glycosyltransferase involved in cell wall biosynthesis